MVAIARDADAASVASKPNADMTYIDEDTMTPSSKKSAIKHLLMTSILTAALAPSIASAEIKLISSDGSIDIRGELMEFDDEFYTIRTPLGDLRISAERVSCEGADCPVFEVAEADFTITGSETLGRSLMPLLMEGYAGHIDAETTIVSTNQTGESLASFVADGGFGEELGTYRVSSTSSIDAFESLADQSAQIGMSSRRILPTEARALKDVAAGDMVSPSQEHIVAVDSLVLITHPSNPVDAISMDQLRDVYTGKITNWSQLGGENRPISVVAHLENSGTRTTFDQRVLGNAQISSRSEIAPDSATMANLVTSDEGAIGYVGFAFQRGAKALSLINECGIATSPTAFSAKTEEYPLQRRMYLYNRADVNENVQQFLDFATSESADGVIRKSGYIDLGVDRQGQAIDSPRATSLIGAKLDPYERGFAQDMLNKMTGYDRLSTTFRFRTGSARLDERGLLDMERLVAFLEDQPKGTEIAVVGFTDSVGAFDSNLGLSEGRASEVVNQMVAKAPELFNKVDIKTMGFGEISPAACNVSETGRAINRRVEIWISNASNS